MSSRLLLGACVLALAACAGSPQAQPSSVDVSGTTPRVLAGDALPPPERADLVEDPRVYYVGAFDTLIIDVFGIEEMKAREIQVDAGGEISFPLAGTLKVAGLTPSEIQSALEQRLRANYVRKPQVTVNVKETVSQVATVEGQVRKPGRYPVIGRMTLLRVIAQAEGTDEFSKLSNIMVFRTVRGQKFAALYDLRAIRQGTYPDPEIYANDVVVVDDSKAKRLFRNLIGIVPALTTPLVVLLQN